MIRFASRAGAQSVAKLILLIVFKRFFHKAGADFSSRIDAGKVFPRVI
jgi:hypothetical protein